MTTATLDTIEIGGKAYGVELLADCEHKTYRLCNAKGAVYDVTQGDSRTSCDCPDWTNRHAELDHSEGCKHVRALVAAGLVANVRPAPPVADDVPTGPVADLPEKYRPRTLADVVGQSEIVYQLREFLQAPASAKFLFTGDTGTGKTSAALAFARDLGCAVDDAELGGVISIESGNQIADNVRDTLKSLRLSPMFGEIRDGGRWKVLIVNECDRMSEAVANIWLDALENLPLRTIVIFSTNHPEKLGRRFVTRCESFAFTSDADTLILAAQARVNEVWRLETGRTDAPRIADLPNAIENGALSFRACLQDLVPLVRRARGKAASLTVEGPAANDAPTVDPVAADASGAKPGPITAKRLDKYAGVDFQSLADAYRSGEKFMAIARRSGIPQSTLAKRLEKLGIVFPTR